MIVVGTRCGYKSLQEDADWKTRHVSLLFSCLLRHTLRRSYSLLEQEISKKTLGSFTSFLVPTIHYFLLSRKWRLLDVEASDETEPTSFDDSMKTNESLRLLVLC